MYDLVVESLFGLDASMNDDISTAEFAARRIARLGRSADLATCMCALIALIVLLGWTLHYEPFKRIASEFTSMNPVSAISFLLGSVAAWLARHPDSSASSNHVSRVFAVLILCAGVSKLLDHILGTRLCPDYLLFASQLNAGQVYPSRIAPNTAACLMLLGITLLVLNSRWRSKEFIVHTLAAPIFLFALLAVLGYLYDNKGFYKVRTFIPMALNSAICFMLMSATAALSCPQSGVMALVVGPTDAGKTARALLPACVLIPITLGFGVVSGLRLEYYGLGTALSLLVMSIVVVLCIAVFLIARRLHSDELQRIAMDLALKAQQLAVEQKVAELAVANRELERANAAKSSFLSSMSHELRTPMNAVIGMCSLLLGSKLTRDQAEYAETIRSSGDHLLTVINEILDFSKIEAQRMVLEKSAFDLRQCVQDAIDLVTVAAAQKKLELAFFVPPELHGRYLGDVGRLRQILINLLSNAVKFTASGEVILSVESSAISASTADLHFQVRDTGIGIPKDKIEKLFHAFSQVDASTTRKYGGTGLGLVISQKLSELMGGRIWVDSEVGAGSTFHVSIRVETAPDEAPASVPPPQLAGRRLLAVDDAAINLKIVAAYAKQWQMDCVCVERPMQALELLASGTTFDVAVLDYLMPEVDGIDLANKLRATSAGKQLPLILLSSAAIGREELGAQKRNFAVVISKPIKPAVLQAALAEALQPPQSRTEPAEPARAALDSLLGSSHPLRILLVEDNPVNQKVATLLLRKLGYQVDIAGNGLEALAAVQRQIYDLAFLDVQMPEMDGLEATRQIIARWPNDRPRIVGMTANATEDDRKACLQAGMDDYIAKPVTVPHLVAALKKSSVRKPVAK